MRVLGIDCGADRTGYGVIDSDGRAHRMLAAGVIHTSAKAPLEARLLEIWRRLRDVIREYAPAAAAVEEVFYAANVKTALKLAHVRGIALLAVSEAGLEFGEYSPLEVKISVVGYGRAQKHQVQRMVRSLLGFEAAGGAPALDSEDACDAIAVAICHANQAVTRRRLRKATV
jgi:crossover junction endodeoxyribonuclease RuvC